MRREDIGPRHRWYFCYVLMPAVGEALTAMCEALTSSLARAADAFLHPDRGVHALAIVGGANAFFTIHGAPSFSCHTRVNTRARSSATDTGDPTMSSRRASISAGSCWAGSSNRMPPAFVSLRHRTCRLTVSAGPGNGRSATE